MNRQRKHWIVLLTGWLGVCLALLLLASCSVQRPLAAENTTHLRATIVLAPGADETALYALSGGFAPLHAVPAVLGSLPERPLVFTLDLRNEQQLQHLTKQLQEQALPVLSMHVEKLGL